MTPEPYHLVKTVEQRVDGSWSEPVFHTDPAPLIGKQLVVAIRYPHDDAEALVHFYGLIESISEEAGIVIIRSDTKKLSEVWERVCVEVGGTGFQGGRPEIAVRSACHSAVCTARRCSMLVDS